MTVLASDSFNRANSTTTLGSTDSYNGGTSYAWSTATTYGISANQAQKQTGSATFNSGAWINPGVSDCAVSVTFATLGNNSRLTFRGTNDSNCWLVKANGTTSYQIIKRVNSSNTVLGTIAVVPTNGDLVKATCNGTSVTVTINGANATTVTDTFNQTATQAGILTDDTVARLDNFQFEDIGVSGTAYTASLNDSITSSETFAKLLSKAASDTITSSETFAKLLAKTVNDSTSATDSIVKSASKTQTDAITTSDTLSKRLTVTIVDTVTSSESTGKADSKAFSDAISSTDSITSNKGKALNLSDSIAIVDTISKVISRFQTDTVALSETKNDATYRGIFDALTASDAITISKGKAILLSDSLTLTDSIGKSALLKKIETLTMADTISQVKALNVRIYDVMVTSESFSKLIPNAPTIIGRIELLANRELRIHLIASRELRINLKGALPVAAKNQTISLYAGESKEVGFTATDSDTGLPLNLTGATIKWAMRRHNGIINDLYKDTVNGIAIVSAATGTFDITFNPVDTALLSGDYEHQAKIVDATGKESVVAEGRVAISKEYF